MKLTDKPKYDQLMADRGDPKELWRFATSVATGATTKDTEGDALKTRSNLLGLSQGSMPLVEYLRAFKNLHSLANDANNRAMKEREKTRLQAVAGRTPAQILEDLEAYVVPTDPQLGSKAALVRMFINGLGPKYSSYKTSCALQAEHALSEMRRTAYPADVDAAVEAAQQYMNSTKAQVTDSPTPQLNRAEKRATRRRARATRRRARARRRRSSTRAECAPLTAKRANCTTRMSAPASRKWKRRTRRLEEARA